MKYKYNYIDEYDSTIQKAFWPFGRSIHNTLERLFKYDEDPVKNFKEQWKQYKDRDIEYSRYKNWEKLNDCGIKMMEDFMEKHYDRFLEIKEIEEWCTYELEKNILLRGKVDFVGVIDLPNHSKTLTLLDFKTSSSSYKKERVILNDQLTNYHLMMKDKYPNLERLAYLVFVKNKTPKLQWFSTDTSKERLQSYINKSRKKAVELKRDIKHDTFDRTFGRHCNWCDFQPLCLKDKERIEKELVIKGE
jgi:RecB family exonuclease